MTSPFNRYMYMSTDNPSMTKHWSVESWWLVSVQKESGIWNCAMTAPKKVAITGFVPFFRNNFPGLFQDFSRLRIDFSRTPKFTLTLSKFTLTLSKFYYFIQFNRFPGLSRTSSIFPGLSSPGKCDNKIPGLSRISRTRTNPAISSPVFKSKSSW